jgi:hypothetical protein
MAGAIHGGELTSLTSRTYTITEAAQLVGLAPKAMRRRTERGTIRTRVEDRNGKPVKVIPGEELVRVGLLRVEPGDSMPDPPSPEPTDGDGPAGRPAAVAGALLDGSELLDRFTSAVTELAQVRLLESQAGERERAEARRAEAAEAELARARAAAQTAAAQAAQEREARLQAEATAQALREQLARRDEEPEPPAPAGEPPAEVPWWAPWRKA